MIKILLSLGTKLFGGSKHYLVLGSIILFSGTVGYKLAMEVAQDRLVSQLESQAEEFRSDLSILEASNHELRDSKSKIKYVTNEVIKEVKVYVEEHPNLASCELGAAGLRLFNGELN